MMTTKTKRTKSNRGRPKKDFSVMSAKKDIKKDPSTKGRRGRPKKEKKLDESLNTKIHKHNKDVNKLSREHEEIHLDIKNTSFSHTKIKKNENKKSDNFALGLLIFSMLLFIFSLYKTFYTKTIDASDNLDSAINQKYIGETITLNQNENFDINKNEENNELGLQEETINEETSINIGDTEDGLIIKGFYNTINNKDFLDLQSLVDSYLRSSNVFRTYYNSNWLSRFLVQLSNEKMYIVNIQKLDEEKENVNYYSFTIRYKLKDRNELFQEDRETAIVNRGGQRLIGSLRCVTTGCSKMPFFNIPRYEK